MTVWWCSKFGDKHSIDVGLGVGDIVLNEVFKNEIIDKYGDEGKDFIETWQKISMVWGVGRIAQTALNGKLTITVNKAKNALKTFKSSSKFGSLSSDTQKLLNDFDNKLIQAEGKIKIQDKEGNYAEFATNIDDILATVRAKFTKCGCANELDDFLVLRIKDKLTDAEIAKLDLDLVGNQMLKNALNNDQELVDVWKNCSNKVSSSRSNSLFLKKLNEFRNDQALIQHIEGIANNQNAVGGHFTDVVGSKILIGDVSNPLPISSLNKNSNGVSQVLPPNKVFIKREILKPGGISHNPPQFTWKEKRLDIEGHTFFPETMSRDEILEQCASAFTNPNKVSWNNKPNAFEAVSESGMIIRYWTDSSGYPTSFFPKF